MKLNKLVSAVLSIALLSGSFTNSARAQSLSNIACDQKISPCKEIPDLQKKLHFLEKQQAETLAILTLADQYATDNSIHIYMDNMTAINVSQFLVVAAVVGSVVNAANASAPIQNKFIKPAKRFLERLSITDQMKVMENTLDIVADDLDNALRTLRSVSKKTPEATSLIESLNLRVKELNLSADILEKAIQEKNIYFLAQDLPLVAKGRFAQMTNKMAEVKLERKYVRSNIFLAGSIGLLFAYDRILGDVVKINKNLKDGESIQQLFDRTNASLIDLNSQIAKTREQLTKDFELLKNKGDL